MLNREKPVLTNKEHEGRWVMVKAGDDFPRRAYVLGAIDESHIQVRTDNGTTFSVSLSEVVGIAPWNTMQVKAERVPDATERVRAMMRSVNNMYAELEHVRDMADEVFPHAGQLACEVMVACRRLANTDHIGAMSGAPGDGLVTHVKMEVDKLMAVVHYIFGAFVADDENKE